MMTTSKESPVAAVEHDAVLTLVMPGALGSTLAVFVGSGLRGRLVPAAWTVMLNLIVLETVPVWKPISAVFPGNTASVLPARMVKSTLLPPVAN